MTELTLFAIFGVPLLLLIMGGGMALWVRYGDRDDNGRRPAH